MPPQQVDNMPEINNRSQEKEHFRELQAQLRQLQAGGTNASVLQCLANMCREEEEIFDRQTFLEKQKKPEEKEPGAKVERWRRRFIRRSSNPSTPFDTDPTANIFTNYVKQKYKTGSSKNQEDRPFSFSENIQDILVKMTSQFGADINDAYKSDPTQVMASGDNTPQDAIRKIQEIDKNMIAIDEDMKILQKTKEVGIENAGNFFQGFKQLGKDDCLLDGAQSSDGSSSEESSDGSCSSDDSSEDDDSVDNDKGDSSDESSHEDETDWDIDSDDESSIDSDFMAEMENELAFGAAVEDDVSVDVSLVKAVASGRRPAGPRKISELPPDIQLLSGIHGAEPTPLGTSMTITLSRGLQPIPFVPQQGAEIESDCKDDAFNRCCSESKTNSEGDLEVDSESENDQDSMTHRESEAPARQDSSICVDQAGQFANSGTSVGGKRIDFVVPQTKTIQNVMTVVASPKIIADHLLNQTNNSIVQVSKGLIHEANAISNGNGNVSDCDHDSGNDDSDRDRKAKATSSEHSAHHSRVVASSNTLTATDLAEKGACRVPVEASSLLSVEEKKHGSTESNSDEDDSVELDESEDGSSVDEDYLAKFASTHQTEAPTESQSLSHSSIQAPQAPPKGLTTVEAGVMALLSATAPSEDQPTIPYYPHTANITADSSITSSEQITMILHATGVGANVGPFDATGKPNKKALRHPLYSLDHPDSNSYHRDVKSNLSIAARLAAAADEDVAPYIVQGKDKTPTQREQSLSEPDKNDPDEILSPKVDGNAFFVSFSDFKEQCLPPTDDESLPKQGRSPRVGSIRSMFSQNSKEGVKANEDSDILSTSSNQLRLMEEKALSSLSPSRDKGRAIIHGSVVSVLREDCVHSDDGLICGWSSYRDWSDSDDETVPPEPVSEPAPLVSRWEAFQSSRKSSSHQIGCPLFSADAPSQSGSFADLMKKDSIQEATQIIRRASSHDNHQSAVLTIYSKIALDGPNHDAPANNIDSLKNKMLLSTETHVPRRFKFPHLFRFATMDAGYALNALSVDYNMGEGNTLHCLTPDELVLGQNKSASEEKVIQPTLAREANEASPPSTAAQRETGAYLRREQKTRSPRRTGNKSLSIHFSPSDGECRSHLLLPRIKSDTTMPLPAHGAQNIVHLSPSKNGTPSDHPISSPIQDTKLPPMSISTNKTPDVPPTSSLEQDRQNPFTAAFARSSGARQNFGISSIHLDDNRAPKSHAFLPPPPKVSDLDVSMHDRIIFPKIDFDTKGKTGKRRGKKRGDEHSLDTRRRQKNREAEAKARIHEEEQYIQGLMLVNKKEGKSVGGLVKSQICQSSGHMSHFPVRKLTF